MENQLSVTHRKKEKKSERLARFKRALEQVVPYLPHTYAQFTKHYFDKQGVGMDMSQIYTIKLKGHENWPVLKFWVEEFVPKHISIEGLEENVGVC